MGVFHIAGHGEFQWNRNEFTLAEGVALEQATGKLFDELVILYNAKRRLGAAAFAWLAMRRHGKHVPWREFFEGLPIDGIRETADDEVAPEGQAEDQVDGQEDAPADPPARAAAKPAAARPRRPSASERKKAASQTK
ncbi:hypothetical protein [Lentzea sp. NBRC 102530]|uniref:hypothetical protein n=1 Tax=Lentzea sp. NBRC 102530 TaxID=3032201 RepID=UPI0024A064A9|nr:hypothetical protein [Lentzea sp. NBRC 102530]GLY55173.1 hypothetical protein Lesp01_88280 [Lentzea sp. NBRC 102530]